MAQAARRRSDDSQVVRRLVDPLLLGLTILIAIAGIALFVSAAFGDVGIHIWGLDVTHYLLGTQRWIDTGSPYWPAEVAAPFQYSLQTFLYPPIALLLFAPFLVLPLVLWWAPLPLVAWCLVSWRPARWTWPVIAAALAYPRLHLVIIVGNSDLWIWAAVALGLRLGWPAVLVVIKPTLLPLLAAGARHRSLYVALAVVALLCLPFGSLWIEWFHVAVNAPAGLFYSIGSLPFLLMPVLAFAARRRPAATAPAPLAPAAG